MIVQALSRFCKFVLLVWTMGLVGRQAASSSPPSDDTHVSTPLHSTSELEFLFSISRNAVDDCEQWAREGSCNENAAFMWVVCVDACVEHAKDDSEECVQWAQEGECTRNPGYVQVHCPEACGHGLSWSPWIRR